MGRVRKIRAWSCSGKIEQANRKTSGVKVKSKPKEVIKVDQTRLMTTSFKEGSHHPTVPRLEHLMCSPYSLSPALEETSRSVMIPFLEKEKEEWMHIKCDGSPLHSLAARSDIHPSLKK